MLKGQQLGKAIDEAIRRKIDTGAIRTKVEVAAHFGIKPPSIQDWIKKGSVSKDKLPKLWAYFADVAGPEHWGMTKEEWPQGLTTYTVAADQVPSLPGVSEQPGVTYISEQSAAELWRLFQAASPAAQLIASLALGKDVGKDVDDQVADAVRLAIGIAGRAGFQTTPTTPRRKKGNSLP